MKKLLMLAVVIGMISCKKNKCQDCAKGKPGDPYYSEWKDVCDKARIDEYKKQGYTCTPK